VHVTLRLRPEIARLRRRDQYRAVRQALAFGESAGEPSAAPLTLSSGGSF
jgi:hypothetical protein